MVGPGPSHQWTSTSHEIPEDSQQTEWDPSPTTSGLAVTAQGRAWHQMGQGPTSPTSAHVGSTTREGLKQST